MSITIKVLLKNMGENLKTAKIGLTAEQHIYLKIIKLQPSCIMQDLAEKLMRDKSQVMRGLDALQDDLLIARIPDPKDRRRKLLVLTEKGGKLLEKSLAVESLTVAQLTKGISADRLTDFVDVMHTIQNNSML